MKKSLISAAAIVLALSAGSALAADLPSRKAAPVYVPPPPPPLWTGFYAGLNAGGTWSESNTVNTNIGTAQFCTPAQTCAGGAAAAAASAAAGTGPLSINNSGFIGGGQVGYNYQFGNSFGSFGSGFVAGLEADIQGIAGSNGSTTATGFAPLAGFFPPFAVASAQSATKSLDYLGTVRGRLGILATPTLLVFASGGLVYGGANSSFGVFQGLVGPFGNVGLAYGAASSYSDTRVGWTVGGGVEWMFLPNWSAKAEYLYYDLGSVSYGAALADPIITVAGLLPPTYFLNAVQASTHFNGHIVRAGVNYHFNWGAPAPVVAKY